MFPFLFQINLLCTNPFLTQGDTRDMICLTHHPARGGYLESQCPAVINITTIKRFKKAINSYKPLEGIGKGFLLLRSIKRCRESETFQTVMYSQDIRQNTDRRQNIMTTFKTGVHTIEFKTKDYLRLSELPPAYVSAIRPEGKKSKHYILTLPKIQDVPEYSAPADTQEYIKTAFITFANMDAGYPQATRIDYRFDDHDGKYVDHLPLMTVLVNLIAYESRIYDRRVFYTDGNHVTTSVRCMPDRKDDATKYGAEYYDKPKQAKTNEYGNARLELRRLNMNGETVQYVVKEWRDILQLITRRKYLAMLEAHAQSLCGTKQDSETTSEFFKRTKCQLIAQEEWNVFCKLNGKHSNHHRENVGHLPAWKNTKRLIDALTTQLDKDLAQPLSNSFHPNPVKQEMPF